MEFLEFGNQIGDGFLQKVLEMVLELFLLFLGFLFNYDDLFTPRFSTLFNFFASPHQFPHVTYDL